jgi:hypothetical protein
VTPLQDNAIMTPSEQEEGRKVVGRGNQGKETEQSIKTGKDDKAPKPNGSITTPARTMVTHDPPPTTRTTPDTESGNGVTGSSGLVDSPKKPPPVPSPGSDLDESTTSSVFPNSSVGCQKTDQTNRSSSSAS